MDALMWLFIAGQPILKGPNKMFCVLVFSIWIGVFLLGRGDSNKIFKKDSDQFALFSVFLIYQY